MKISHDDNFAKATHLPFSFSALLVDLAALPKMSVVDLLIADHCSLPSFLLNLLIEYRLPAKDTANN